MPRKNSIKTYVDNGYYHVYNRGVEKRKIFMDEQDYKVFLGYLEYSLSPPPEKEEIVKTFTLQGLPFKGIPRLPKNYYKNIKLVAYCLMPNHFHLLIKQADSDDMSSFMNSVITRYSMYFNKKRDRVGSLFQGPYKAVLINEDAHLLHLTRYIHTNPSRHTSDLADWYSSYADYLRSRNTKWVNPKIVLKFFNKPTSLNIKKFNNYRDFVEKD